MLISNNLFNTYTHSPTINKKTFLVKDGKVTREGWKFLNNSGGDKKDNRNNNSNTKQNNKKGEI